MPVAFEVLHHGATDGVTGSCHELRLGGENSILIDCGLFQGEEASRRGAGAHQLAIDFPVDQIRALLVTHVHIDHVGRIPYLVAAGFKGPILCSPASAVLLPLVLDDALRMGVTHDRELIETFLGEIGRRTIPLPFGRWQDLDVGQPPLKLRLGRAGHILGSAYVECRVGDGRQAATILFSGDLGAPYTPLLPAPTPARGCDCLVLESTYGDQDHPDRRHRRQQLRAAIEHALADGGTVLIPAFSIGRTQELLYELEGIIHDACGRRPGSRRARLWQELNIVVDSPLAARFTEAYRQLRPYWDDEARQRLRAGRHPLSFEQLITVHSHEDHLRLVHHLAATGRPAVVIAASGMCAGGRVVSYLKALIGDARNDILFVGYQARGTPGREILEYGPSGGYVMLDGERYPIRAKVTTIGGYSAHAGQQDLIRFVTRMRRRPQEIRLVHGDLAAKAALGEKLRALGLRVAVP